MLCEQWVRLAEDGVCGRGGLYRFRLRIDAITFWDKMNDRGTRKKKDCEHFQICVNRCWQPLYKRNVVDQAA